MHPNNHRLLPVLASIAGHRPNHPATEPDYEAMALAVAQEAGLVTRSHNARPVELTAKGIAWAAHHLAPLRPLFAAVETAEAMAAAELSPAAGA